MLSIEQRLAKLEQDYAKLSGKKETWLMARDVMAATSWNKERLRRARANGEVEVAFKKNGQGKKVRRYLLESISSIHIIK